MKITKRNIMGMPLIKWKHKSSTAYFATGEENGEKWATLYSIVSEKPGKGHARELLTKAKAHYEEQGRKVGGSIALNKRMSDLYKAVGIEEYL